MKRSIVAFIFACVASFSQAQDFKEAVVKAQHIYNQLERFHAVMQVNVYDSPSSPKPYVSELAEVHRDGENYKTHYGDVDFLLNKHYSVAVNRATRQIVVNGLGKDLPKEVVDPIKMNFDSLVNTYQKTQYLGTKDNLENYRVFMNGGPLEAIDVSFNTATSLIQKMAYIYKDKGLFVSITFSTFDQHPSFSEQVFDEHNYIVVQSKKIVPAAAYRGYNIIYQPSH